MTPYKQPDEEFAIRNPQSAIRNRAFITGAGGFVGKHLLRYLSQHTDWELYGNASYRPDDHGLSQVKWLSTDLTDRENDGSRQWPR